MTEHPGDAPQSCGKELSCLESLQTLSREVTELEDWPVLLERILRTAVRQTQSGGGVVGILSADKARMEIVSHVGWGLSGPGRLARLDRIALRGSPFASVLRQKRLVAGVMVKAANGSDRRKRPRQRFLAAPLLLRDMPMGVLAVASKPQAYSAAEKLLLEAFANLASFSMENDRLRQALERSTQRLRRRGMRLGGGLSEQLRDLRDFRQTLQERKKLAAMGHLAGAISHELRQPLSAINNIASYLKATVCSSDRAVSENLRMLEQQAEMASRILSNMIQFARSGKPKIAPANLHAVLQSVLRRFSREPQIRWKRHLDRGLPLVLADPVHVDRILSNLIANSLESMEAPGTLTIATHAEGGQVSLEISDTGCGIPAAQAGKIFEPFFSTKRAGTGLGLALCRQLAEANGGAILFQSRPGRGTRFELRLPQA